MSSATNAFETNAPKFLRATDARIDQMVCAEPVHVQAGDIPEFLGAGFWTTTAESPDHSIARLIRSAEQDRHIWLVEDLWQPNTIMVVHSLEGGFKSVFAYQIGEALATRESLLRKWAVPTAMRVGILQTEMPDIMVGQRLKQTYPSGVIPANLIVSNDALVDEMRRKFDPSDKFQILHNWITSERIDVVIWDTINNMLSACGNPNSEEATAKFYDYLEALPHKGALVVRHDGKPSKDSELRASNQKVRGSNAHAEIASVVIHLGRPDKRSNRVVMEIGKLRHGSAPDPMDCWFDIETMRLTLIPPVITVLERGTMSREALYPELLRRFSLKTRNADAAVNELQTQGFLLPSTRGHERLWSLNAAAEPEAETRDAEWWRLVKKTNIAEPSTHPHEICNVAAAVPEAASSAPLTLQKSGGASEPSATLGMP